ncbi:hypothetical protein [Jannaschia aquimarina]|uniref:tRNA nuclease CdiA C-terminal domain-containing protein n=1 Tax=Jannaschia aquimarina TaxID=935700 RepID=A0A0D1EFA9_9RHOB|nr:hypothetical protein [Jannaschia aquimarina]KIT15576.1 hypothetical protein jaqu_26730 [Jannaschia aquimarina]SNT27174.1 hypothetical protein SAMN05421775_109127 [Jannaschia aquimarina]
MGFYQRYEDTRRQTKEMLSSDIEPRPGTTSRFPPGIEPAALTTIDDSSLDIASDAFATLQNGTTDIAALSAATKTYAARFAASPEVSIGDRSQDLGPATLARFRSGTLLPPDAMGEQQPHEDEDCPDYSTPLLLSSLGGMPPSAVSSHCGETEGLEDGMRAAPILPSQPIVPPVEDTPALPSTIAPPLNDGRASPDAPQTVPSDEVPTVDPAPTEPVDEGEPENDDAVDTRTEEGHREKGSALTGFIECGRQTLIELWELITELLGLAGGGIAAAWERWGPGWFTDDDADEQFGRQIAEIRDALEQNAKEGVELLAALHTYFGDTLDSNAVFSALTRAILLVYTEDEWAAMAARGRDRAEQLVAQFRQFMREDPDYAVGFLVCQIGQMLLGGGALLRIVKTVRRGIPDGDRPDLDRPDDSESPETIVDDPDGNGAATPNGPAPQAEGDVRPDYLSPDDPDAVELYGGPDNGGVPRYGRAGTYAGQTPDEIRAEQLARSPGRHPNRLREIEDLVDEGRSGQDLADAGYRVEMLDDSPGSPSPYGDGDYGYDADTPNTKRPDYRINGVIFDHFSPRSPEAMLRQITNKLDKNQSRNFVVRIGRDGGPPPSAYLSELRRFQEQRFAQVIIIDNRTGRILTYTNPAFSAN